MKQAQNNNATSAVVGPNEPVCCDCWKSNETGCVLIHLIWIAKYGDKTWLVSEKRSELKLFFALFLWISLKRKNEIEIEKRKKTLYYEIHSKWIFLIFKPWIFNNIGIVFIFVVVAVVVGLRNNFDRDYIGFATLPEQVHRKSVKRGFDFTLMVIGGMIYFFLYPYVLDQNHWLLNAVEFYLIRNGAWQVNVDEFIVFGRFI